MREMVQGSSRKIIYVAYSPCIICIEVVVRERQLYVSGLCELGIRRLKQGLPPNVLYRMRVIMSKDEFPHHSFPDKPPLIFDPFTSS